MSTVGVPIKLLNEAQVGSFVLLWRIYCSGTNPLFQGHVVTLELSSGQTYRGKLLEGKYLRDIGSGAMLTVVAEDNMNVQLRDVTVTARDGKVTHLEQVYVRGSHVKLFIIPDMLR